MCPDKALYQSSCLHHKVPLRHTGPCPATWTREIFEPTEEDEVACTVITHFDKHNHGEPPNEQLSNIAAGKFGEIVTTYPRATPTVLKQGVEGGQPVHRLHSSLINADRVKYQREKVLKRTKRGKKGTKRGKDRQSFETISLQQLPTIEKDLGYDIFPEPPSLGAGQ